VRGTLSFQDADRCGHSGDQWESKAGEEQPPLPDASAKAVDSCERVPQVAVDNPEAHGDGGGEGEEVGLHGEGGGGRHAEGAAAEGTDIKDAPAAVGNASPGYGPRPGRHGQPSTERDPVGDNDTEDPVQIPSLDGEALGPWRAGDAVALLEALKASLASGSGRQHIPQSIADPVDLLLHLEAALHTAGIDMSTSRKEECAPVLWDLAAKAAELDLDMGAAAVQDTLPDWAIYNDEEAMEQAADSIPEAIVGSPKGTMDEMFMLGEEGEEEEQDEEELPRLTKSVSRLGKQPTAEDGGAAAASNPTSKRPQPKKSKHSVHNRLKKKLRIK